MFKASVDRLEDEYPSRKDLYKKRLSFGVKYLDDCLGGILTDDLVIVGAPSGAGKTQFCVNVALANIAQGRRVHFFALEASYLEIERRLKYQIVADIYFSRQVKPYLPVAFNYPNWVIGLFGDGFLEIEKEADEVFKKYYSGLSTFYKSGEFNVNTLIENVLMIEQETDLMIIDHVHYFDWDDESDNRAVKKIAMTARDLALESNKPIILVSHLRKRDKQNKEIAAGIEEFHGSSDLFKVSTKVITLAAGGPTTDGKYYTYFRAPKFRNDAGVTRYLGMTTYDPQRGCYEDAYKVGWANAEKFGELTADYLPYWAK